MNDSMLPDARKADLNLCRYNSVPHKMLEQRYSIKYSNKNNPTEFIS